MRRLKTKRVQFTPDEDKQLLLFLAKQLGKVTFEEVNWKGNLLWKLAEVEGVTPHSYGAMRDHVKRVLIPRLNTLPPEVLSEDTKHKIGNGFAWIELKRVIPMRFQTSVGPSQQQLKKLERAHSEPPMTDDMEVSLTESEESLVSVSAPLGKMQLMAGGTVSGIDNSNGGDSSGEDTSVAVMSSTDEVMDEMLTSVHSFSHNYTELSHQEFLQTLIQSVALTSLESRGKLNVFLRAIEHCGKAPDEKTRDMIRTKLISTLESL